MGLSLSLSTMLTLPSGLMDNSKLCNNFIPGDFGKPLPLLLGLPSFSLSLSLSPSLSLFFLFVVFSFFFSLSPSLFDSPFACLIYLTGRVWRRLRFSIALSSRRLLTSFPAFLRSNFVYDLFFRWEILLTRLTSQAVTEGERAIVPDLIRNLREGRTLAELVVPHVTAAPYIDV